MRRVERPRIEVVRVSSTERAKLLPLLEGGVQLQARFKHHLSNNYASCSSLDDTRAHVRYEGRRSSRRQQPLATKSCDNIYVGQLSGGPDERGPFMWQDTTRSEEQLCPDCHDTRCCTLPAGEATKSEGHINQITKMQAHNATPLRTRFRLISLLKKLSPRPRRFSNKVLRAQNVFPWVVVEFSNKDLDSKNEQPSARKAGRCNSEDSTSSDKSFAMTVRINKLRKQQALEKEVRQLEATTLAAPRIVIASPSPSATLRAMSDECKPPCRNSLTRG